MSILGVKPRYKRAFIVIGLFVLVLLHGFYLQWKYHVAVETNLNLSALNQSLQHNSEQQTELLMLQQATNQQLQKDVAELQDKVIALNKDLLFYKNVTSGNGNGIQVRDLQLKASTEDNADINYRFLVSQGNPITTPIKGHITLSLNIIYNGEPERIQVASHPLRLRYVQAIQGSLKIDDFDHLDIDSIAIAVDSEDKQLITKIFDWTVSKPE